MRSFLGRVSDSGLLSMNDPKAISEYAKKFSGNEVVVTLKKRPTHQGSKQMRYYRGVVVPDIAAAIGETDPDAFQEIHEGLGHKFLRLPDDGSGISRRRSTAKDKMSAEDFTDYVSRVIEWAESSIPGCRIRRPDEVDPDELVEYAVGD
jgi:hypothetical protein